LSLQFPIGLADDVFLHVCLPLFHLKVSIHQL
jgi:hypothetical protein